MAESDFLRPQAQDEARRVIAAIERETSAEVVVTVRRVSGRYREADYLAGFIVSLAALVALLFVPREFALWSFPLDVALAFALGAWASSRMAPVRRFLTPRRREGAGGSLGRPRRLRRGAAVATARAQRGPRLPVALRA